MWKCHPLLLSTLLSASAGVSMPTYLLAFERVIVKRRLIFHAKHGISANHYDTITVLPLTANS